MTGSGSDFVQPPWVYGPKETMDWIEATNPSKKGGKKHHHKREIEYVKNMVLHFDLQVQTTVRQPDTFVLKLISKITRNVMIEEHFDSVTIAEVFLRACAKAKFKNTNKIVVDGTVIYDHPEITSDLRKTISLLEDSSLTQSKQITLIADHSEIKKCVVKIIIRRIHRKKDHSLQISFSGELSKNLYNTFVNYVFEKLDVQRPSEPK